MRGAISAGDRLTAQAGAEVLREGGNAFDAVVSACFASPVTEPALTSAGGGGFLLAFPAGEEPVLYDFFVDVPERKEQVEFYPIEIDFGSATQEFHIGAGSVAVPGFVAGLLKVHRERGRLPLKDVLQPAIEYARKGVVLSSMQAGFLNLLKPILTATEGAKRVYMPSGELPKPGELFKNPDYADFLENLALEGEDLFYKGAVAKAMVDLLSESGGSLSLKDLERYTVFCRKPLKAVFGECIFYTNPPPSSGGILIAFSLRLLSKFSLDRWGTVAHAGTLLECMRVTAEFRRRFVNRNLHRSGVESAVEGEGLLSWGEERLRSALNLWGNTTHISAIDAEGNGVSVTTSNGEGSGYVVPGTGIMLNNMLGEEDLNPHGFFCWQPGVRLPSMMAPSAVVRNGKLSLLLGSAGSNRIRSAILQVVLNREVFRLPVERSVELPRLHLEGSRAFMEPGFPEKTVESVVQRYPTVLFSEKNLFFGGVQAVAGDFTGAGDSRRGGYFLKVL